jgi:4-cresol dehydrogenase (hydroxylating) cytochrome subunit
MLNQPRRIFPCVRPHLGSKLAEVGKEQETTEMPERYRLVRRLPVMLAGWMLGASIAWSAAPAESAPTEGRKAYEAVCRHCHEAGVGPELRGRQLQPIFINLFVRRGMRAMPAFPRSFIDDAVLQQLGEFLQKSPAPSAQGAPR